ncbi:SDR family NAD(P)-dependent oxidoreductase [Streptomyces sp. NPDC050418]|uniref:SDR family NAD(P)-dependent oxidoreductase n=1 Tax=Streptomyces sp. NPDC050418 TaxID=3365612 RepID=UPI00379AAB8F
MTQTQTVIGVSPFGAPDVRLVAAVARAGGLGVLDLGGGGRRAREALALARAWAPGAFGVRIGAHPGLDPDELRDPAGPHTVLLAPDAPWGVPEVPAPTVLVEVRSAAEAAHAVREGAAGIVVRGSECGGEAGELSTFVLLQQVVGEVGETVPVWACGGIGPRTAAAAVVAGAAGVVLDVQLALLEESDTDDMVARFLRTADGSESVVVEGRRVLDRRRPGLAPALRDQPLPLGQDAFLAARFAEKYGTVAAAVAAVRNGIDEAAHADTSALRGGTAMCRALGTALPVAQGPMAHVSDQAGFAAAVADGGGLPFLALPQTGEEQTRALMERTREALGDRPWGVGLLGFAPEEVRTAQLDAVRELRPSHAVLSGGRPAQAAELEAEGVATFLHAPSSGLLEEFLAAGARRFVLEGAECGGPVGPRNSFPLWEAQLAVLEDFLDAHDDEDPAALQILFAGGIHDERSAAMVAALAAPLTERGAATGVLMGTAYLFTEEAVDRGAIRPLFQQAVLAADSTVLLHTAPGHATRCVPSAFTAAYETYKEELRAQGVPERQAHEEMERLNTARLRIAGKGIERVGDELVDVDEERRLREGLFAAGEVAVLRAATTTVAALHHGVGDGAAAYYARRAARLRVAKVGTVEERPVPAALDVAVVGLSAMFPGAPDLDAYWAGILAGEDGEAQGDGTRDGSPAANGGFLAPVGFDPLAYGIEPDALAEIEPVQLLALEAARHALEDAGLDRKEFPRGRTCVVFGAASGGDTVLSGRIAGRLGLGGAGFTVDAGSASSLMALDAACKELTSGAADVALCGGAEVHDGVVMETGTDTDSGVPREGVACVVLKRRADAERDGDRIYAVIKGIGSAGEGPGSGPRPEAGRTALGRAHAQARVSPADVGLVETPTAVADAELAALSEVFEAAGAEPGSCVIDSAASRIGHTGRAAGLAGLIKAALALHTGVRPPTELHEHALPWTERPSRRVAAVGASGSTAVHVVLKAFDGGAPPRQGAAQWPAELFVLRSREAAEELIALAASGTWRLRDLALVAARSAGTGTLGAVVADSVAQLPSLLRDLLDGKRTAGVFPADPDAVAEDADHKVAFLFPGQGSQRPGMLAEVFTAFPATQRHLLGLPADVLFPPAARDADERAAQHARLTDTRHAQPALGAVSLAAYDVLTLAGVRPDLAGGHSYGELVALCAAGSIDSAVLAGLSRARAEAVTAALGDDPGAMAAVAASAEETGQVVVRSGLADQVVAAHHNAPARTVISGPTQAVGRAVEALNAAGLPARPLPVACAFHSPLVARAVPRFSAALAGYAVRAPEFPVWANRTGTRYGSSPADVRVQLAEQIGAPVRFAEQIEAMYDAGARVFVEAGPGTVLTGLVGQILGERPHTAVPFEPRPGAGLRGHLEALARLFAAGVPVTADRLLTDRATLPTTAPRRPAWTVDTHLIRTADGTPVVALPRPSAAAAAWLDHGSGSQPGEREVLLREFLQNTRETLTAQRDALVAYFGGADSGTADPSVAEEAVSAAPADTPAETAPALALALANPTAHTGPGREPSAAHWGALAATAAAAALTSPVPVSAVLITDVEPGHEPSVAQSGAAATAATPVAPAPLATARRVRSALLHPHGLFIGDLTEDPAWIDSAPDAAAVRMTSGTEAVTAPTPMEPPASDAPVPHRPADSEPQAPLTEPQPALLRDFTPVRPENVSPVRPQDPTPVQPEEADLVQPEEADLVREPEPEATTGPDLTSDSDPDSDPDPDPDFDIDIDLDPEPDLHPATEAPAPRPTLSAPTRHRLTLTRLTPAPAPGAAAAQDLRGKRFVLVGDGTAVAQALVTRLTVLGAIASRAGDDLEAHQGSMDGLIHVGALADGAEPVLPGAFPLFRAALSRAPRWLLAARYAKDTSGLDGFFRTVACEYPDTIARSVEIDGSRGAAEQAEMIVEELLAPDREPVVRRTPRERHGIAVQEQGLSLPESADGGRCVAEASALGLGPDSVVVIAGGARGITARCAVALAAASRCRIELLGRTELPDVPDEFPDARGREALRAALTARGGLAPETVERTASVILAQREIAATLAEIHDAGGTAGYRAVDVRDAEAVQQAVKETYTVYGRIDGVIHAAGVVEDRPLAAKDPDSFRRVYGTKVDGARVLLAAMHRLPRLPRFTVLFGSLAAVLGNPGQIDYTAANDALARIGHRWQDATGTRALTVHWGPWAPTGAHDGMVGPEQSADYARRGIELIDPDDGVRALLRELAWGDPQAGEVIYTASGW